MPIVPKVKRLGKPGLSFVLSLTAACGAPPPAQAPTKTTPAAAPASSGPEIANHSEAAARAEALLEDFKQREAAQAKFDRENPAPRTNPIPISLPDSRPTPSPAAPASPAATETPAAQPAPAPVAPAASGHDEAWWKEQRRSLQAALDDALAKLAEAEKNNLKYGYNDAQALYKKQVGAVAEARLAIDRLHDEARRAGVPPGWLR